MKKIIFFLVITSCFVIKVRAQQCSGCPNQQTESLPQQPTIFISKLPTVVGAYNSVSIYLDEPPTTDFLKRRGVGHIWVSINGVPVKLGAEVEIINVSPGYTWNQTFIKTTDPITNVERAVTYPKRVPGMVIAEYSGDPNNPIKYRYTL